MQLIWHTNLHVSLPKIRKDGTLSYLRPDGKTQVTVEYNERRQAGSY